LPTTVIAACERPLLPTPALTAASARVKFKADQPFVQQTPADSNGSLAARHLSPLKVS